MKCKRRYTVLKALNFRDVQSIVSAFLIFPGSPPPVSPSEGGYCSIPLRRGRRGRKTGQSCTIFHLLFLLTILSAACQEVNVPPPKAGEYGEHVVLAYNESTKEISGIYKDKINTKAAGDSCYFYFEKLF